MNAKLSNFSELSNILSVKSSLRTNLMSLFTRFGLGHLLCRMSLEKQAGIPAVQLILSLCLFRIAGESIHSMYKKSYYDLLNTGHNCYYRMMRRATMDWRKLLMGMALRFLAILRKEHAEVSSDNASYIFDDTTLEKTGYGIEQISRVSSQYDINNPDLEERIMAVIDYISGMTDIYALDIYQKINGISLPIV